MKDPTQDHMERTYHPENYEEPPEPECTCEENVNKRCPIHGFCPDCSSPYEEGPCDCNPSLLEQERDMK